MSPPRRGALRTPGLRGPAAAVEFDHVQDVGRLRRAVCQRTCRIPGAPSWDRRGRRRSTCDRRTTGSRSGRRRPRAAAVSSKRVSSKCPRWFVPNWISKPSAVRPNGVNITPALFISTSMAGASVGDLLGRGADGVERGQVQRHRRRPRVCDLGMYPLLGLGERAVVARGEDDVRTGGGECSGGFAPEAGGGAGDHAGLAGQVDAVDHLHCGGLVHLRLHRFLAESP